MKPSAGSANDADADLKPAKPIKPAKVPSKGKGGDDSEAAAAAALKDAAAVAKEAAEAKAKAELEAKKERTNVLLVPPGRIVHLYVTKGVYRAVELPDGDGVAPFIGRIEPYMNMMDDHRYGLGGVFVRCLSGFSCRFWERA